MKFPLGTSSSTVHSAPLLLIDLETKEGITGRTYLFCYRPSIPRAIDIVLRDAISVVKGSPVHSSTSDPSSPGASRLSGWQV
jgi:mandelate racemase